MNNVLAMWLGIFGLVLIASFWMGAYYLSEWKCAYKHQVEIETEIATHNDSSRSAANLAGYKVDAKVSVLIWAVSFIFTLASLGGVFWVLATKL